MQVDNLSELPRDKQPPDDILWEGDSEELDEWLDSVFSAKKDTGLSLTLDDIEE